MVSAEKIRPMLRPINAWLSLILAIRAVSRHSACLRCESGERVRAAPPRSFQYAYADDRRGNRPFGLRDCGQ